MASISSAGRHTFREEPTPNADASVTEENVIHGASNTNDLVNGIKARVEACDAISKVKPVLAIEYMITASPEAFKRHGGELGAKSEYFNKAMEWLEKKHGAKNIISSTLHLDEKTPHLAIFVVPVVEEKAKTIKRSVNEKGGGRKTIEIQKPAQTSLNAKHFLGGREKLSAMQDDFHTNVASYFKLQRGEIGTSLKHVKMRDQYKKLTKAEKDLRTLSPQDLTFADKALAVVGVKTKNFKALEDVSLAAKVKDIAQKQNYLPELFASANSKMAKAEKKEAELKKKQQELVDKTKAFNAKVKEFFEKKPDYLARIAVLEQEKAELAIENNKLQPKQAKSMTPTFSPGRDQERES